MFIICFYYLYFLDIIYTSHIKYIRLYNFIKAIIYFCSIRTSLCTTPTNLSGELISRDYTRPKTGLPFHQWRSKDVNLKKMFFRNKIRLICIRFIANYMLPRIYVIHFPWLPLDIKKNVIRGRSKVTNKMAEHCRAAVTMLWAAG